MKNILQDKNIFPDFPRSGPLAAYRKVASFDWRKLKLLLEDEELLRLKQRIWDFFENHPLFQPYLNDLPHDQFKGICAKRMLVCFNEQFLTQEDRIRRPELLRAVADAMYSLDPSFGIKQGLAFGMFPQTIISLGTDRLQKYIQPNRRMEIIGAFGLTEIAHGTNAKGMRTEARYDPETEEYVIHTPDFEAAKCWIGNLGKTCTHAIIYAQLYTPDGVCHGLHAFLVPIRNPKTLLPYPGITVGDLGEKIGLNGIDNCVLMFNRYRIPRENLLAKTGDVTPEGKYVSAIKDKSKRLGASLVAVSTGRVGICGTAASYATKAITIAVRYSAARRQFGPDGGEELPVLEYQAQQYRLLPHLASVFAIHVFSYQIAKENGIMMATATQGKDASRMGLEMHALSSAAKPICSWTARDIIQECREACGGHGYLKVSRLGDLRNDNDANCTYEGENNVLIQQASNWLIGVAIKGFENFREVSPFGSAAFLANFEIILKAKFRWNTPEEATTPEALLETLNWLVAFILKSTLKRVQKLAKEGKSRFEIRNDSQTFYAHTLAIVYAQRHLYFTFFNFVKTTPESLERVVLTRLLRLFGTNLVLKHHGFLYQGGFAHSESEATDLYQEAVLKLLPELKKEAVALVDAIAPPDFILNSPLGARDGEIYKHLQASIFQNAGTFTRPSWWKDIVYKENYLKSKI